MLNDSQIERYSRQIILPEVGARGQEKLLSATLAVVDPADSLSIVPLYLAAAGIGRLKIWRPGAVSVDESADDISALNPDCAVEVWTQTASRSSCETLVATDNPTAVIFMEEEVELAAQLNAACIRAGTPLIWGRAVGAIGYLSVFDQRLHPGCRACALPFGLQAGDDEVLQPLAVATLATQLASEAIKSALGSAAPLAGKVLRIDVVAAAVTTVPFASDTDCAVCSRGRRI